MAFLRIHCSHGLSLVMSRQAQPRKKNTILAAAEMHAGVQAEDWGAQSLPQL